LASRLRVVYEGAANDLEVWNKSAAGQLDAQLRDRRRNYSRRVEAVVRIQDAAGELETRMQELAQQVDVLDRQGYQLEKMASAMLEINREHVTLPMPLAA
ncbi:MAG: dynamin family protein, partial [Burkholderiaceae bacterium]